MSTLCQFNPVVFDYTSIILNILYIEIKLGYFPVFMYDKSKLQGAPILGVTVR
ncbi:protein of unknown function (plasmid) [Methylotuvimicrobium alcaliphilum 20Z]|uniref:Uncharacterized protein n=1 Tax=Methylotuvimicrobium alcaliphilum (strain DSM 19304 / NCIMB 14124 / VKM B-2133 / 20Z) TaxID=1091494 RepID=G4T4Q2_META2|nr:protein of unknown function [Methylotuvimicrobium alcaliphilum 20Z]